MARSLNFGTGGGKYLVRDQTVGYNGKFTISFWFKLNLINSHSAIVSFGDNGAPNNSLAIQYLGTTHQLDVLAWVNGGGYLHLRSNETITDTNTWHHCCLSADTTKTLNTDRVHLYLDRNEVSYNIRALPPQNLSLLNSGRWYFGTTDWDPGGTWSYVKLDEPHYIDGLQLTPGDFISGSPGGPIGYNGSYGPYGFHLDFEDNTSTTTLGYDRGPNGLNWGLSGFSINDSTLDAPAYGAVGQPLVVGSPVLGSPELRPSAAAPLTVGSPALGVPTLYRRWALPNALELAAGQPVISIPNFLSFSLLTLADEWDVSANARVGGYFMDIVGTYTAILLTDKPAAGPFQLSQVIDNGDDSELWRVSFEAKASSSSLIEIGITDDGDNIGWAIFNPVNGACVYRSSLGEFRLLGAECDPLRFGFIRFVILVDCNKVATLRGYVRLVDDAYSPTYTGTGLGSVILNNPAMLPGSDARNYRWEIGEPEIRFYWTVHVGNRGLRWFRAGEGECGVDPHLTITTAEDLECVLQRWKPAHTALIFDYSTLLPGGTGDPMEGTP